MIVTTHAGLMRDPLRCTVRRCGMALLLALGAFPTAMHAQLGYDYTTFVHGTASDGRLWTKSYAALGSRSPVAYLATSVSLRNTLTPTLDARQNYFVQRDQLVAAVRGAPGQHVLVGHSLGGIEARGAYLFTNAQPHISGIFTVAATHRGTHLADNREQVKRFFADVQRRVDDGGRAVKEVVVMLDVLFATVSSGVFTLSAAVGMPIFALIGTANVLFPMDTNLGLDQLYGLVSLPAVIDQATTSPVIRDLQASLADSAIPRANIYGQIPFRNAAIRVQTSLSGDEGKFEKTVRKRNQGMSAFKACKVIGYSIIIGSRSARRCSFAAKVLGRVDERWMGFVNGRDAYGRARAIPFDGVVSNENSQYPTRNALRLDRRVDGVNHQNIYSTQSGLRAVSDAMLAIGMEPATAPSLTAAAGVEVEQSGTAHDGAGETLVPPGGVARVPALSPVPGTERADASSGGRVLAGSSVGRPARRQGTR